MEKLKKVTRLFAGRFIRIWKCESGPISRSIYLLALILLIPGCVCLSQIQTQYYFANDSCEFYLPDYSQAIEVRDNCCVDENSFVQIPNSGTLLVPGQDVSVTIIATDCFGNKSTMKFDVVVIDNVPPTFYYDSTEFLPVGMYQNEDRIYHFWTYSSDSLNPEPPVYYSQDKEARDRTTGIGTTISDATFRNPEYYKMSLFMASSTYRVIDMYMAIAKTGNPQGFLNVEIWQLNIADTTLLHPICGTRVPINTIHPRPGIVSNLPPSDLIWQTVNVSNGILIRGGWYAIRTYCEGQVDNDNVVIWNTTNYAPDNEYQFLKYSYNKEVSYGTNKGANYMFQIWGVEI